MTKGVCRAEGSSARVTKVSGRGLVIAVSLLAVGGAATEAASRFLVSHFPHRPLAPDLLFELVPQSDAARVVASVAIVVAVALFGVYAIRREPGRIPEFVAMLAVMYILRAVLLVVTPLANANAGAPAAFPLFQYGMFPSGHTAVVVLCTRFVHPALAPRLRRAELWLALLVCACLVLARSHYTIDIAGGALLAYFIEREWSVGRLLSPVKRLLMTEPGATD